MADDKLLDSIAKIADHVQAVAPMRKVKTFEYMRARKKRNKLTRKVFMSGNQVREKQVSDEQIALLNKLRGGKYMGGRVVVLERDAAGAEGGVIDILPRNKQIEDRMYLMGEAPNLTVLLTKILAEQDAAEGKRARR